jgi:hypothetical protein
VYVLGEAELVLVAQVDICPDHVLTHTLDTLHAILKKPGVKKKPFQVIYRPCCNTTKQT